MKHGNLVLQDCTYVWSERVCCKLTTLVIYMRSFYFLVWNEWTRYWFPMLNYFAPNLRRQACSISFNPCAIACVQHILSKLFVNSSRLWLTYDRVVDISSVWMHSQLAPNRGRWHPLFTSPSQCCMPSITSERYCRLFSIAIIHVHKMSMWDEWWPRITAISLLLISGRGESGVIKYIDAHQAQNAHKIN